MKTGNSKIDLHESVLDVNVELALDGLIAAWEDTVPGISFNSRRKIVDELTDDVVDAVDKANSKAKNISVEYAVPVGTFVKLTAKNGKTFDLKTTQFNIFDSSDVVSMSDDLIVFSKGSSTIAVPRSKIEKSVHESKMKITVRQFKKLIRESILLEQPDINQPVIDVEVWVPKDEWVVNWNKITSIASTHGFKLEDKSGGTDPYDMMLFFVPRFKHYKDVWENVELLRAAASKFEEHLKFEGIDVSYFDASPK